MTDRCILGIAGAPGLEVAVAQAAADHGLDRIDKLDGLTLYAGAGLKRSRAPASNVILGDYFSDGSFSVDWGNFLAFSAGPGKPVEVSRAPLTGMPLYFCRTHGGLLLFSHLELVRALEIDIGLDVDFLRHLLAYSNYRTARTGLAGVEELLSGTRLTFNGHVTQVRQTWSPWPHVRKGIYDRDAVPLLNSTIRKCVSAWAKERRQIMLELSGGLDSSIVAAALAAEDHGFAAATIATASPDGDERRYARAVAERCGAALAEYVHDDSELDLAAGPQFISPRPATYGVLAGIDAALGAATAQLPGASIFTGIGGDNVFAITRSILPVIDAIKVREPIRRPAAALGDCARLCDVTIWHAARAVYRHWRRPPPTGWPREDEYCTRSALPDAPLPHLWDHGAEGIPPGKIKHVQSIQRILDFLDRPGRWHGRDVVAPLLSQPVVELCLSIPGWQWVAGGRDRAAAREAFASRLPEFVVWRRNKGRLETLCAKTFIEQRARLRPILLEGRLAREGLLDRERIEAYLARERLAGDYDYFRLLELADIELWIASIEGFGRVPASLAQRAY
jgi:asparagine synthase (glutamine-hydrolysing)